MAQGVTGQGITEQGRIRSPAAQTVRTRPDDPHFGFAPIGGNHLGDLGGEAQHETGMAITQAHGVHIAAIDIGRGLGQQRPVSIEPDLHVLACAPHVDPADQCAVKDPIHMAAKSAQSRGRAT